LTDGVPEPSKVGDERAHFEESAYLEAAAVIAFERLERELIAHGAPRHLVRAARRAARDERAHARIVGDLAAARGGVARRPPRSPLPVRPLVTLAVENAGEGVARETYGALLAIHQARHALAADVRAAMACIADDEVRHAALARAVARWAERLLSPGERARVRRARRAAMRRLEVEARAPSPVYARDIGLPSARVARRMVEVLARSFAS
jgi:hypothetical protein